MIGDELSPEPFTLHLAPYTLNLLGGTVTGNELDVFETNVSTLEQLLSVNLGKGARAAHIGSWKET